MSDLKEDFLLRYGMACCFTCENTSSIRIIRSYAYRLRRRLILEDQGLEATLPGHIHLNWGTV